MSFQNTPPYICILLATYNGGKFLHEQLQSIENQTYKNWKLVVSDDGSNDDTLVILHKFKEKLGNNRVSITHGPQQGFCQNFLSLACNTNIKADLYAFSDQDDVWFSEKLERAVSYFKEDIQSELPIAYGTRTLLVDEELKPLGKSTKFTLPSSFRNALVQNIAGGNTQVFNRATKKLLEQAGKQKVVSHDWWLYLLVKGAGGDFYYDSKPTLMYRQHHNAIVGEDQSIKAKIDRVFYVLNGRLREWNNLNCIALNNVNHLLTNDSRAILHTFNTFRHAKLKDRVRLLEVCGLYRQRWNGTLSLWLATILGKV